MQPSIHFGVLNEKLAAQAYPAESGALKISCLMVSRGRYLQARIAIDCFLRQTYSNRELIVVSESCEPALREHIAALSARGVRLIELGEAGVPLGEQRNISLSAASGELVCVWDDDDLYDPRRLEIQYGLLRHTGARASLMQRVLLWWPQRRRLAVSGPRNWEATILCQKSALPKYPPLRRSEDLPVIASLCSTQRVVLCSVPRLYIYLVHGGNTWPAEHFEAFFTEALSPVGSGEYETTLRSLGQAMPIAECLRLHAPIPA